jgi:mannobiose 2-epimerase
MKERLSALSGSLEKELRENILDWWMKYSPDKELGGFHGHIDHHNRVVPGAGKGAIMHARILWTFSAAYRMYPDPAYLDTAERAYAYILTHFLDHEHGGIYWELEADGRVKSDRKQIYAIAFTIYALAEYHLASGERRALDHAFRLFRDIEDNAMDLERNGYTDALSRQWEPIRDQRLSDKDQNESKTMNTHLHILEAYANLCRTWKDPEVASALGNLVDLFLEKFVDPESLHLKLFFNDDWELRSNMVSYGHDIECAWLLHEAAEVLGDQARLEKAEKLAVDMARRSFEGLDVDGGMCYEYMPGEKHTDTDKHWWPQAEAMVGYFNAYQLSGEETFAEKTLASWNFIQEKMVDRQLGEWIWSVDREGRPQTEKEKAGFWKCPYHNGRACMQLIRRIEKSNSTD